MATQFIRFIGDVHGKFNAYKRVLADSPHPTIQVGDMGVGFRSTDFHKYGAPSANPPYDLMVEGNHRFIRGNHDNPEVCAAHTQCYRDGTFDVGRSMMFIGGAFSIDWEWRIKDYSWWADEELSTSALQFERDSFAALKPRVMVTHTCPTEICDRHVAEMIQPGVPSFRFPPSRTEVALQEMFEAHQPELWVYGHWHRNKDWEVKGTRFVCLDELCTFDAEV